MTPACCHTSCFVHPKISPTEVTVFYWILLNFKSNIKFINLTESWNGIRWILEHSQGIGQNAKHREGGKWLKMEESQLENIFRESKFACVGYTSKIWCVLMIHDTNSHNYCEFSIYSWLSCYRLEYYFFDSSSLRVCKSLKLPYMKLKTPV